MRQDIFDRKMEIVNWINENQTKAFICRQLICKPETLDAYLKKFEIEYSGNKGAKGKKRDIGYVTADEYVTYTYVSAHRLRIKLIKEHLKEEQCEICGLTEWNGEPIPLELDHIDGNHFNNEFSNLRILCPNCHAQTPTNSGKNVGRNNPAGGGMVDTARLERAA